MPILIRKIEISAVAALLSTVGLSIVHASPAVASPCSWYWQDIDTGSEQVIHPVSGYPGIAMRTGAYQTCDLVTRVPWGNWVTLDCYVNNGDPVNGVSKWSHVRYGNGGPLYSGWINNYYLSNGGSKKNCS